MCWYPIIDRPDWDHLNIWHQSGLWDRAGEANNEFTRRLHEPTAQAFLRAQALVAKHLNAGRICKLSWEILILSTERRFVTGFGSGNCVRCAFFRVMQADNKLKRHYD